MNADNFSPGISVDNSLANTAQGQSLPAPAPRYKGVRITAGGRTFILPSLSIRMVIDHRETLESLEASGGTFAPGYLGMVIDLTLLALRRNYPNATKEEVEEFLDLGNVKDIILCITGRDPAGAEIVDPAHPSPPKE
jgi:hypothetical protein